ncbi:hypothetical protein V2W30_03900 [Streptomyces sp. Q6]|uniref:Uncharacterized protein n=1 Tax=Streptomyces citrinus TaxID=3118173 RepID=A0ACD5A5X2_9ACTN
MSTRAVVVAAVITGLILGVVGARADDSTPSRRSGSIAESHR